MHFSRILKKIFERKWVPLVSEALCLATPKDNGKFGITNHVLAIFLRFTIVRLM